MKAQLLIMLVNALISIEASEVRICFRLPTTYKNNTADYNFNIMDASRSPQLQCGDFEYVRIDKEVTYMLPDIDNYCLDDLSQCPEPEQCDCCEFREENVCKARQNVPHLQCNVKYNTCSVEVNRYYMEQHCDCIQSHLPKSSCFSRWVNIKYQCLKYKQGSCEHQDCSAGHGSCVSVGNGQYYCDCYDGYSGYHCQESFNDCIHHKCNKYQNCVDAHRNYTCVCKPGYTGSDCETNINECRLDDSDPCGENGKCIDGVNTYKCKCFEGFEMRNGRCETATSEETATSGISVAGNLWLLTLGVSFGVIVILLLILLLILHCYGTTQQEKLRKKIMGDTPYLHLKHTNPQSPPIHESQGKLYVQLEHLNLSRD